MTKTTMTYKEKIKKKAATTDKKNSSRVCPDLIPLILEGVFQFREKRREKESREAGEGGGASENIPEHLGC